MIVVKTRRGSGRRGLLDQPAQGVDALGDDVPVRADPVVGQAVPGGQPNNLRFRREERHQLGELGHVGVVTRHLNQAGAADLAKQPGDHLGVQPSRRVGDQNLARCGETLAQAHDWTGGLS